MAETNGNVESIIQMYDRLINSGIMLLRGIRSGCDVDVSSWLVESIDHIFPVMPLDIPEYTQLHDLRQLYLGTSLIVPSTVDSDINHVIQNLNIAKNVTICGTRGKAGDIPPKNYADIFYDEIKETKEYVEKNIIKALAGKEDGRTKNTAMLNVFGRLYCWASSITRLNKSEDIHAISSCTRGMLEVYVDLIILHKDVIDNDIEKYFSHDDSKKHKDAEKIHKLRHEFDLVGQGEAKPTEIYLNGNPKDKIDDLRKSLWGNDNKGKAIAPMHWSNKNMIERVRTINDQGLVAIYLDVYYYCNWYVHSGYINFGRNIDDIHRLMGHLYNISGEMFMGGVILINKQIPVISEEGIKELNHIKEISKRRFWGELVEAGRKKQ